MEKKSMLVLGSSRFGWGLYASRNIAAGTIVLQENPFLVAPTTVDGLFLKFLSLTDEQLHFLATLHANVFALTVQDEAEIERLAPKATSPHWKGFRWFLALMKSNAHGLAHGVPMWAIYEHGCRVNHSCTPNVAYRNENGTLIYVTLCPIEKGKEIFVSYVDTLYASKAYREQKILKQKLFICDCEDCCGERDASRQIWCPHCRSQEEDGKSDSIPAFATYVGTGTKIKHLKQYQMTQQMNKNMKESDEWWICSKCQLTYTSAILPVAVEQTLTSLFLKLDSQLAMPNSQTWQHYLMYLHKTALTVLGPLHWLSAACHYLYSRFYVAVWNGGDLKIEYKNLATDHGMKFFEYVEKVIPAAIFSDVVPWASVLIRFCLATGDAPRFTALTVRYLPSLRLLYGNQDATLHAYEKAVRYLVSSPKEASQSTIGRAMADFATESLRKLPDAKELEAVVPSAEHLWLHTKAPVDKLKLEGNAQQRKSSPWDMVQPVPKKFALFAQAQLSLMSSSKSGEEVGRCKLVSKETGKTSGSNTSAADAAIDRKTIEKMINKAICKEGKKNKELNVEEIAKAVSKKMMKAMGDPSPRRD
eukprot:Gregarina_sp_Poly_1__4900@NODE_25_length_19863_cov_179_262730_g23_i0_p3_GENE_NODE_25_length_19863_cov_179_262730_g23_i0NODE_25_length_19863_cov_179_262730_g23_i0_p3_ORF_typecomplete_len588_score88_48SET/PF00856_28/9e16SET/PF00856_28/9_6e02_NODE_25_length_19863_cov_179_262730_g23_i0840410167